MHGSYKLGYAAGALMIAGLMGLGMYLPSVEPGKTELSEDFKFGDIIPSKNPAFIQDQLGARRVVKKSRSLQSEYDRVMRVYNDLPPFTPPEDGRLTQENIDDYIGAYQEYVSERKYLKKHIVGKNPGIFRVLALVGMINQFHEVTKFNSFVKYNMTEEQFEWTKKQVFWAALYCVEYKLANENPGPEDKKRLMDLQHKLYKLLGIIEIKVDDKDMEHEETHLEKLDLGSVPRTNIELFIKNAQRINYIGIHFNRPTVITFDRDAIMAAAKDNPA